MVAVQDDLSKAKEAEHDADHCAGITTDQGEQLQIVMISQLQMQHLGAHS